MSLADRLERWSEEAELMDSIRGAIMRHTAPPVFLGAGRKTLAMKFRVVFHSLMLLCQDTKSQRRGGAVHSAARRLCKQPSCFGFCFDSSRALLCGPGLGLCVRLAAAGEFFHCPQDPPAVARLSRSIPTWLSDYGTEVGFARVRPVAITELLPYVDAGVGDAAPDDLGEEMDFAPEAGLAFDPSIHEVDFADEADALPIAVAAGGPAADPTVDVSQSLEVPGLLHIISNAGKSLSAGMEHFDDAISKLTHVAKLLADRESKERLYETCYADSPVGREMFRPLLAFKSRCYAERWGNVSHCVTELTSEERQASLRWGWDLTKYMNGSERFPQLEQEARLEGEEQHKSALEVVDESILDPFWWAYLQMLSKIATALNTLLAWSESCSCHWQMLQEAVEGGDPLPKHVESSCLSCPMRGRRCADLAAGSFLELLQSLCEERAARLLLDLPPNISEEQRLMIIGDFERGRVQLVTQFTLKLAHYSHPPYCIMGLAHNEPAVRANCLRKLQASLHPHPRAAQFRESASLMQEAELFLERDCSFPPELTSMPALRALAAEYRLALCAERCVEAPHARTKREVARAPSHSEPFTSLAHRMQDLTAYLGLAQAHFQEVSELLLRVRHGRHACETLGLGAHPSTQEKQAQPRSPVHWKVVYHNDPYSKYKLAPPQITSDDPGARPEQPGAADGPADAAPLLDLLDTDDSQLRQHYYSQHLRARFDADTDVIYCMPLTEGSVHTLQSALDISPASSESRLILSMPEVGVGGVARQPPEIAEKVKNLVFFKIVGRSLAQAVRTKVQGQKTLAGVRAVSVHRLLRISAEQRDAVVSLTPMSISSAADCGNVPFVLDIKQLSRLQLKQIKEWRADRSQVVVRLANHYTLSDEQSQLLPSLMKQLTSTPDACEVGHASGQLASLISKLESDGMVQGPPWKLTVKGAEFIELGVKVAAPIAVIRRPEALDGSASVAALICELDHGGWTHAVVSARQAKRVDPYVAGPAASKIWYTKKGKVEVISWYLLALLKAEDGAEVPHFAPSAVYQALLGISPAVPRRSRCPASAVVPEADWPEDHLLPKPKRKPRQPRQVADESVSPARSSSSDSSRSSSSSSAASSNDSSSNASQAGAEERDCAGSCSSSDSGSSGSGSPPPPPAQPGGGASSGHAQGSAASSSGAAPPPPVSAQGSAGDKLKRPGKGFQWKGNRVCNFTRSGGRTTGFQMTCLHPLHQDEKPALCTKSRQHAAGAEMGDDIALRMLKLWAILGASADVTSKASHQLLWKDVMKMHANNQIPSMVDLDNDARMPATWADLGSGVAPAGAGSCSSGLEAPAARKRRKLVLRQSSG